MKKILPILFNAITNLIIIMAIYYIAKFTIFYGKDVSPIAFGVIFLIGSFLGDIVRNLMGKKIRPK